MEPFGLEKVVHCIAGPACKLLFLQQISKQTLEIAKKSTQIPNLGNNPLKECKTEIKAQVVNQLKTDRSEIAHNPKLPKDGNLRERNQ